MAYRWTVNGAGSFPGSTLSSANFNAGNTLICYTTPNDGYDDGAETASASVQVQSGFLLGCAPFTPDGTFTHTAGSDPAGDVHWKRYAATTFDECQAIANATCTQYVSGEYVPHTYTDGWLGDQDGSTTAIMRGGSWTTEAIVDRFSPTRDCIVGKVDERKAPTVNPSPEYYVDSKGRKWRFWRLTDQSLNQAQAFANAHDARIIGPGTIGESGKSITPPTHWNYAAAEFNGTGTCNTYTTTCDFIIGHYIGYAEQMPPDALECDAWNEYRDNLSSSFTYTKVTLKGSNNETGVSCTGAQADQLCQAVRQGIAVSVGSCDGRNWSVGECSGVEINANGGVCGCSTGYVARPCLFNGNFGGIDGSTCGAVAQRIDVLCE